MIGCFGQSSDRSSFIFNYTLILFTGLFEVDYVNQTGWLADPSKYYLLRIYWIREKPSDSSIIL